MTKKFFCLLLLSVVTAFPAGAVEVPSYVFSNGSQSVSDAKDAIIKALTSTAVNSEEAMADTEAFNIDKRRLAAALYAEAVTTRTNLLKKAKGKGAQKALGAAANLVAPADERDILSDEILPWQLSIAERLNSIVSMEAGIAVLDGTLLLTSMPGGDTTPDYKKSGKED